MNCVFESLKIARKKYINKIDYDIFQHFIDEDKSKTFKYVEKMCEIYYENNISYIDVIKIFRTYQKLENFIHNKDLTNMSIDDILNTIEDALIYKNSSKKNQKRIAKNNSLIYNDNNIKVYHIKSFEDMQINGKGTDWCISLNKSQFNLYDKEYDIYVILNKNLLENDKFKKICYLINDDNEMIVDKNNVHYFSDTKEYQSLKDKLIPDYIY